MAKKVAVVTGYAGFIGSTFTKKLLERGYYVYCIDRFSYLSNESISQKLLEQYKDRVHCLMGDICHIDWLPDCDVIFNLAAESDVDIGNQNVDPFIHSNILGVKHLISLIQKRITIRSDKPLFFQVSTDEV